MEVSDALMLKKLAVSNPIDGIKIPVYNPTLFLARLKSESVSGGQR